MISKLIIRNFKRLKAVEIELGGHVVWWGRTTLASPPLCRRSRFGIRPGADGRRSVRRRTLRELRKEKGEISMLIGQGQTAQVLRNLCWDWPCLTDCPTLTRSLAPSRTSWSADLKVTDEFLDPLFANYYEGLGIPQQIFKKDYHGLADAIPVEEIAPEVTQVLDDILDTARRAQTGS